MRKRYLQNYRRIQNAYSIRAFSTETLRFFVSRLLFRVRKATLMTDVFSKDKRSFVMKKVRSKGNKSTELRLVNLFKENRVLGWRQNYSIEGRPDFVFLKKRLAIFVDGCFWHGHDCRNTRPNDNANYWQLKRERNMRRDENVTALFESRGWKVVRIWECELRKANQATIIDKIKYNLNSGDDKRLL
jgi:DNA mismatch endonuclease (patch repair protein)